MLILELDSQTETRFHKLASVHNQNYNELINSMVNYRIHELKRGIQNIELDFVAYESKHKITSANFYKLYQNGGFENDCENNDFMIWSAEYESYLEFQNELKQLL